MQDNVQFDFSPRFQGKTYEHMVEALTGSLGPFDGSPADPARKFDWKVDFWSDGPLSLITGQFSSDWRTRATSETPECLSILLPRTGSVDVRHGGHVIEAIPGRLVLVNNHEAESFFVRGEPHLSDVLRLNWTVISQMATALLDMPLTGALGLSPSVDLTTPSGRLLGSLTQAIVFGMRDDGPLFYSPIAMSHLTQALADLVVRSIPHRFSAHLDKKPFMIAPSQVRRAIDFMNANIHRAITMPMVAAAAGVSVRALETSFRAFRETTPAAYLRTMRLRAVREDLLDPSNPQSVRDICLKWGFFHMGRFSAIYRTVYGENPSDTKRRSWIV